MRKLVEPTPEQIDETVREIEEMARKYESIRRRLHFQSMRPETLFDKNGDMFLKDEDGDLHPVESKFFHGKVYFHSRTFTLGLVCGDFIIFRWNNKMEESFFPVLLAEGEWQLIGNL